MWTDANARELGATLRRLRHAKGLSQEALAHRAGITKNQLQLLEAGRSSGRKAETGPSNPRMTTLSGLASVLDVPISQILVESNL
ncbi:helix-turn-helix domain-containing protein [Microbacterium aurantiacum]|uniref:DNA-binding protein n=1 Tax=Microbacterium aurantiacum TaxID=162393 RepID=A0A0M9VMG5_9MICO|nr:helix-turn-helix transcriptional regulator [Microbacterium chocolatum]ANG84644.1 transcriptional regulator [Microbacterium chocolatum]KOS12239.1 DNA-binding protein [Microbacterium chocolatum]